MSKETRLCRLNLMVLQDKPEELRLALRKTLEDIEKTLDDFVVENREPYQMSKQEYIKNKTAEPGQSGMARLHGQYHLNYVADAVAKLKLSIEKAQKMYPNIHEHPVVRAAIKDGKVKLKEKEIRSGLGWHGLINKPKRGN